MKLTQELDKYINTLRKKKLKPNKTQMRKEMLKALSKKDYFFLIAEAADKPIGFIFFTFYYDKVYKYKGGFVVDIFVEERYRNKGIGSRLLKEAVTILKKKKAKGIRLETDPNNRLALKVWKKMNFKERKITFDKKIR